VIDVSASGHYVGDCRDLLKQLPDQCIQACVTSPPYWGLRDYGVDGQLGLEQSPYEYVANMVGVVREVRRALRDDGTLWLNLGDTYATGEVGRNDGNGPGRLLGKSQKPRAERKLNLKTGMPKKNLIGVPWMVAFALREDGWILRSEIIWSKPGGMPENADRPSRRHEHVFMLSRSARYRYTADTDHGTVWPVNTSQFRGAHFAPMPPALAERAILCASGEGDIVLDPFFGSGTTGMVAEKHGRKWIGFDLNPEYEKLQKERTAQRSLVLGGGR
jgi:site-specific DNA-methyltransferase (cytosine-N4-specific)